MQNSGQCVSRLAAGKCLQSVLCKAMPLLWRGAKETLEHIPMASHLQHERQRLTVHVMYQQPSPAAQVVRGELKRGWQVRLEVAAVVLGVSYGQVQVAGHSG